MVLREPEVDPGFQSVQHFLLYGLSLPERALRSTSAVVGGALRESTSLLIPQAFRSSRTYSVFVQQMIDFLVHNVGGVATSDGAGSTTQIEGYVARKTVGNFIEMAGWTVMPLSPLTVLAIVADVAYGSQSYLKELSAELKKQGVIDEQTTIDHASDLLAAINRTSAIASQALDTPPLSAEGLQRTVAEAQAAASSFDATRLIPRAEIERLWNEMHELARRENVSVMEISTATAMYAANKVGTLGRGALSTVTVAGNIFERDILGHYAAGLQDIGRRGFYATLADASQPYIGAVWRQFALGGRTWTEAVLSGELLRHWLRSMRIWWRRRRRRVRPA